MRFWKVKLKIESENFSLDELERTRICEGMRARKILPRFACIFLFFPSKIFGINSVLFIGNESCLFAHEALEQICYLMKNHLCGRLWWLGEKEWLKSIYVSLMLIDLA